jgi:RNA-directed DNA polymerase
MALLRRPYGRLRLKVNETKSAVGGVFGRKFLGYSLWVAPDGVAKRKVAAKPLLAFRQRIRELTRRSGGRSMKEVVEQLRSYVLGSKAYFLLAQTPGVWRELDEWLRHRLRAIQLKHWRRVGKNRAKPFQQATVALSRDALVSVRWRTVILYGAI